MPERMNMPRKTEKSSIENITNKIQKATGKEPIDEIVAEAVEWARKPK